MNSNNRFSSLARSVWGSTVVLMALAAPLTHAATVWTGPLITFTQTSTQAGSPLNAASQDRLTTKVFLTRASKDRMFNAFSETFCTRGVSPSDTEWASGTLANPASLTYRDFSTWVDGLGGGHVFQNILNVNAVVHLKSEDIYLSVKFTAWASGGVGGYSYQRSTPAAAAPSPSVSITNPVSSSVFAAPANVKIAASSTVSSGSVTNVSFFTNGTLLASAQAAPFSITASNLAAGAYNLTAVATATGVSGTSSVVNVSVVSPVTVLLSAQKTTNSQFAFDYTANPGLSYLVQNSSNLVDWLPVVTNVAASNPVHFAEGFVTNGFRYYRVGRLPNP